MLKTVPYHRTYKGGIASVAYVILGNKCVFTACQASSEGSSVNNAEDIITAIAEQEGCDPRSLRYFDIKTRTSYGEDLMLRPNPGDFEFDEVVNWWEGIGWSTTVCPQHVSDLFREYIDGEPHQVLLPAWKVKRIANF